MKILLTLLTLTLGAQMASAHPMQDLTGKLVCGRSDTLINLRGGHTNGSYLKGPVVDVLKPNQCVPIANGFKRLTDGYTWVQLGYPGETKGPWVALEVVKLIDYRD